MRRIRRGTSKRMVGVGGWIEGEDGSARGGKGEEGKLAFIRPSLLVCSTGRFPGVRGTRSSVFDALAAVVTTPILHTIWYLSHLMGIKVRVTLGI